MPAPSGLGTHAWTVRTGGHLSGTETRALLAPIAKAHAGNAVGRLAMLARLSSGRRRHVDVTVMMPPSSALTRAAEDHAQRQLTPMLLNHSYRTYAYGMALGALEDVEVDRELFFAAAMLHDVGLTGRRQPVDFTLASAEAASDVAEAVGLPATSTDIMRDAITLHHTPGVTLEHGPVAYLLSAGAGVDVAGLRSWQLPPEVLQQTVEQRPRLAFKQEFDRIWREEAAAVPAGRAKLLRRYAAFGLAIRLAPFRG